MSEVIFNKSEFIKINRDMIQSLKEEAENNTSKKARICLHTSIEDRLHEMIIVHKKGAYIRPHKHPRKTESFHIIEGSLLFFIFDDNGNLKERVRMSEKESGKYFAFRLDKNHWHTVVPETEYVVFHEITNGPFTNIDDSVFPDWAPNLDEKEAIDEFMKRLL